MEGKEPEYRYQSDDLTAEEVALLASARRLNEHPHHPELWEVLNVIVEQFVKSHLPAR